MSGLVAEIRRIWSDQHLVVLEREIWLVVMEFQRRCDPNLIGWCDVERSAKVVKSVDLDSINARERRTKHDLKARLEEFAALSGHSRIHLGMTSADLVENTYPIRIQESLEALGLNHVLEPWLERFPIRGIRGPVGSDVDMAELIGVDNALELQRVFANWAGFANFAVAPTQNSPRSYDFELATQLAGQSITREVYHVVAGAATMFANCQPWLEGDVSTSVVRRHAWPLLFGMLAEERDGG